LSMKSGSISLRAGGVVRVTHPEYGMGVEFIQTTSQQHDSVHQLIETLRATGEKSPELLVEPDGLDSLPSTKTPAKAAIEDTLVELFRHKEQIPLDVFLTQMREQRQTLETL
jgi:hypothetical protein